MGSMTTLHGEKSVPRLGGNMAILAKTPWLRCRRIKDMDSWYYYSGSRLHIGKQRAWVCEMELHRVFSIPLGCDVRLVAFNRPSEDRVECKILTNGEEGNLLYLSCDIGDFCVTNTLMKALRRLLGAGYRKFYAGIEVRGGRKRRSIKA